MLVSQRKRDKRKTKQNKTGNVDYSALGVKDLFLLDIRATVFKYSISHFVWFLRSFFLRTKIFFIAWNE